ncbi:fimbria/pilus outer membrane usher protein [Aeromonas veronii]|uniref:fimbria/pilus outer membrane usher protein n=1 Tax=Aeromonas veronii TaxID=654 RepID=UPI003D1BACD3
MGQNDVLASTENVRNKSKFNSAFLHGASEQDLERFLAQGNIVPGQYRVELYLNDQLLAMEDVIFSSRDGEVEPCITPALMEKIGVKDEVLNHVLTCVDLAQIEHASWDYDAGAQKLRLSIPQAALKPRSRGYVDPALWDQGLNVAFVNYNLQSRFDHNKYSGDSRSHYLGLNSGVNIGPWRLRNQSQLNGVDDKGYWKSLRTYAERDLTDWRSQLSAGQINSSSEVFNSQSLRGVQIRSDDAMLPDELRGYSPVVTGVADTNATVEIRQGDNLIFSSSVAPGPFEFRDIPTYGSNGDLEITVIEADGTRKVRTQGFGMLPVMVREGTGRYQFSLGQLDTDLLSATDSWYASADGAYGLLSDLTLYGGVQGMQHYYALNAGLGFGSRLGSFSFDVTHSDSDTRMGHHQGQSYRFRYGRVFHDAGTTLALSGYRYATEDYRSIDDHIRDYSSSGVTPYRSRTRSNMYISVSQRLASDWGSLTLAASETDYWDKRPTSRSLSASYGNSWQRLSYQLGAERSHSSGRDETRFTFYASLPLSWGEGSHSLSLGGSMQQQEMGGQRTRSNNQNLGLSGYWDGYSYNLTASRDNWGNQRWSASSNLRSAFGEGGIGFSQGSDYHSVNTHWAGSLIAHNGGKLNAAPTFYDGAILVEVPDQQGVGFRGSRAKTGSNGFALLENSTPYRRNQIWVDSQTLAEGVELQDGTAQVVPRRGAVTYAKIAARKVNRVQFTLLDSSGQLYPFGTQLELKDGSLLAMADPHGRALALLDKPQGELVIVRGKMRCTVPYQLAESKGGNFSSATLRCPAS